MAWREHPFRFSQQLIPLILPFFSNRAQLSISTIFPRMHRAPSYLPYGSLFVNNCLAGLVSCFASGFELGSYREILFMQAAAMVESGFP